MTKLLDRLRGKRVGVVLSAGYFGFYGHAGFVEGLALARMRHEAGALATWLLPADHPLAAGAERTD